jgi:D-alanine-D-alanine ligase
MARVLLLFGGQSAEHEVSCASAVSIHDALEAAGHGVIPVGIDRSGEWLLADPSVRPFRAEGRTVQFALPAGILTVGEHIIHTDVAFPVLHGPKGEDGAVQGALEVAGIPYVGCDVRGSAVAMDKHLAKTIARAAGVDTAPWVTVRRSEWLSDPAAAAARCGSLRFPVFVKPVAQGSSIGIAKVDEPDALAGAMANAFRYDDSVVVEQGIDGREIEVAVLDGPRASVPGEVVLMSGWYTYDAKYADQTSRFDAPADLPPERALEVARLAERVFSAIGLSGLARIDFFLEGSTGRFLFNEANTMPGFTSISGFPKMWEASGMSYPELCDHLVSAALERHDARSKLSIR